MEYWWHESDMTFQTLDIINLIDIETICGDQSESSRFKRVGSFSTLWASEHTPQLELNLLPNCPTNRTIKGINLYNLLLKLLWWLRKFTLLHQSKAEWNQDEMSAGFLHQLVMIGSSLELVAVSPVTPVLLHLLRELKSDIFIIFSHANICMLWIFPSPWSLQCGHPSDSNLCTKRWRMNSLLHQLPPTWQRQKVKVDTVQPIE